MSSEVSDALRYAFRLLSYRDRSEREFRERLGRKGFSPHAVQRAIEKLGDGGYIDDGALAVLLRRRAEEVKLLGAAGAGMYLRRMGIPRPEAAEALEGYDERPAALRLIRAKAGSLRGLPPEVLRRRLIGYLRRRGYSAETVFSTLNEFMKEST